jgi:hypothetical protein
LTKFLVLYRSSVSAGDQMANITPEQAQAGMDAWMQWAGKATEQIVDLGSPLAPVTVIGQGSAPSNGQQISGFSILQAESRDAVTGVLEQHPHFHSPGESSIEILEFLPMPGA